MNNEMFEESPRIGYLPLLAKLLKNENSLNSLTNSIDWGAVERNIGVNFPQSFKSICDLLPAGVLGDELRFTSPVSKSNDFLLDRDNLLIMNKTFSDLSEVSLYPNVPGYLVFATTSIRTCLALRVECQSCGGLSCKADVFLVELVAGIVEPSGMQLDELLYRCITNNPPLTGELSINLHEWIFKDLDRPLFSPI